MKGALIHLAMLTLEDVTRWTGLFKRVTSWFQFKNDAAVFGEHAARQIHRRSQP